MRLCQLEGGLPAKANSAEVLQLARDLHIAGRQQGSILSRAFENSQGNADMRAVAAGMVFLCRASFENSMAMSFTIFQDHKGTLTEKNYMEWVGALSKMAKICAQGSCK
eukprot:COSAG05_NODE_10797_length_546_cov_0.890380_1_plen_108_part_10